MSKNRSHTKQRLGTLREAYRGARQWHYGQMKKLDQVWSGGIGHLQNDQFPIEPDAVLDALESAIAPFLAHVFPEGTPEKKTEKPSARDKPKNAVSDNH